MLSGDVGLETPVQKLLGVMKYEKRKVKIFMKQEKSNNLEQKWLESLDAMIAAPDHHTVLLENEKVRVLDSLVKPGEQTPVHTHRWASVLYILGTSDFVRCDADGMVIFDSRRSQVKIENGTALFSPPLPPHYVKNVGDGEIRVISVELKNQV